MNKKIFITWISLQTVLFCLVPAVWAETEGLEPSVVSAYKDVDAMWELVSQYSPSDEITAAVVTQIYFESFCVSNAVGGGHLTDYADIKDYDEFITNLIDESADRQLTKEQFANHIIDEYPVWGYGLIQWVEPNELEKLFDFAEEKGTPIGDAEMQVEFIFSNMQKWFPEVWDMLMECDNAGDAAVIFAHYIGGTNLAEKLDDRRWFAKELMKEYGE